MSLTPWEDLSPDEAESTPLEAAATGCLISFVITAHSRREVLLQTLNEIDSCGLSAGEFEVHIIEGVTSEDALAAATRRFPLIQLMRQGESKPPLTRHSALAASRGKYIVFLDDDCYPFPGSPRKMIAHFEADERLGAAVFLISRADGTREASTYPNILISRATGLRREAIDRIGGNLHDSLTGGEDYDLSMRLLAGGWRIKPFEDLRVAHMQQSATTSAIRTGGTRGERMTQLRVEKQLELATRYFPRGWVLPFARDWMRRQRLLARSRGHDFAYYSGLLKGVVRAMRRVHRTPVNDRTFEALVRMDETRNRLQRSQDKHRFRTVLLLDLGGNMLAFWRAIHDCGVKVVAVADPTLCETGRRYRGVPIVSDSDARAMQFDAAIICHISPIWSAERRRLWQAHDARPVIELFGDEKPPSGAIPITSARPVESAVRRIVARIA